MTFAAFDFTVKSAVATSKITRPGAGIANRECHASDSLRETVLANMA